MLLHVSEVQVLLGTNTNTKHFVGLVEVLNQNPSTFDSTLVWQVLKQITYSDKISI